MAKAPKTQHQLAFDGLLWTQQQVERYGPILGGDRLRKLMGYRTLGAFQRARQAGDLEVRVFQLPRRRGHFAVTAEVCEWLLRQRDLGSAREVEDAASTARGAPALEDSRR